MLSRFLSISLSCLSFALLPALVNLPLLDLPLLAQEDSLTELASAIYRAYINKQPLENIPDSLTFKQAQLIQDQFIQHLLPTLGKPVGYKAGLTNPKIQEKLGVSFPIYGVLLEKMLFQSGANIPINFGTRPQVEGDLIVRVKSEKINQAQTREELLNSLDAVLPFLELPDLVYEENIKLTAPKLVAINVGARRGIIGEAIPIENCNLQNISVTIFTKKEQAIATGNSRALLGDPLNVIIALRDHLKNQGKFLKKGDLISLGSLTPMIPITSSQSLRAEYQGLKRNQPVTITVNFTNPEPD